MFLCILVRIWAEERTTGERVREEEREEEGKELLGVVRRRKIQE